MADDFVWVDENGVTHITNDPDAGARVRPSSGEPDFDEHPGALWNALHPRAAHRHAAGAPGLATRDRITRLLRGAVADLRRGEIVAGRGDAEAAW